MKKPWKVKGFWHSIHWSIQQTAIASICVAAMIGMCINMSSCTQAMNDVGGGSANPDYLANMFVKSVGCGTIAVASTFWYAIRKKKYIEEHPREDAE